MNSNEESRPGNRPVATFKVKGSGVEVALWKNGENYSTSPAVAEPASPPGRGR